MVWLANRIIKIKYRKQIRDIKECNPGMSDDMAMEIILGNRILTERRRVKRNIIACIGTITILTVLVLAILLNSISYVNMFTSTVGNTVLNIFDEPKGDEDEDEVEGWIWGQLGDDLSGIRGPGGIYPKDPKLRLYAELLEILDKASEDVYERTGIKVEPAWILGTAWRETTNRLFNQLNSTNATSLLKDLLIISPACGKGNCKYMAEGISHYHGGTVSGGKDTGDPYTQAHNHTESTYNRLYPSGSGGHAVGYMQFESYLIYHHLSRMYGNTEKIIKNGRAADVQSQLIMDEQLGFVRPNPFYIPDSLYNAAFILGSVPTNNKSNPSKYRDIINSAEFKSLSERNQNFIKFVYGTAGYVRGNMQSYEDEMARELIRIIREGKIQNLDEMINSKSNKYWNSKDMVWKGSRGNITLDIKRDYGINIQNDRMAWQGVWSANMGRIAYDSIVEIVEAAEKEETYDGIVGDGTGNWVGKPGSGRFGNSSGSKYYLDDIGIRWYYQSSRNTTNSESWGSIRMRGMSESTGKPATLASGGCGIYTVAMIASNLLDKDITPDMAISAIDSKYYSSHLSDAGATLLAKKLGLQVKTYSYKKSDIIEVVKRELGKGNMILFVGKGGPYPWYGGDGHFMALRGVTDDGKFLGISSVGNSRHKPKLSAQQVMNIPITPDAWLRGQSPNRDYIWIMGLNVD